MCNSCLVDLQNRNLKNKEAQNDKIHSLDKENDDLRAKIDKLEELFKSINP